MSRVPVVHVVDRDAESCAAVRDLLDKMNLRCAIHTCGQEFLDAFDAGVPGCVILEVHIPKISGLEIQHRLAQSGATQPVIFLTAQPAVSFAVRAMSKLSVKSPTELVCLLVGAHGGTVAAAPANGASVPLPAAALSPLLPAVASFDLASTG